MATRMLQILWMRWAAVVVLATSGSILVFFSMASPKMLQGWATRWSLNNTSAARRRTPPLLAPGRTRGHVKRVLVFGEMVDTDQWIELRDILSVFRIHNEGVWTGRLECPLFDTTLEFTLSSDVDLLKGQDAVIFGVLPKIFKSHIGRLIRLQPGEKQTWIYYSTESPYRVGTWARTLMIEKLKYHVMMTYRRDSDIPIPFGYFNRCAPTPGNTSVDMSKKKDLIVWIASNCAEVTWPRIPFIEKLSQFLPVHTYGRCGSRSCLPMRSERCHQLFRGFKFQLALANSECRDYITEKFWLNSLRHDMVPVVYGAPREDFEKLAPPHSFIHVSDFPTLEALADYIKLLDRSDDLYQAYFDWKRHGTVTTTFPVTLPTMCKIIPHLYNGTARPVRTIRESTWYNGCRESNPKAPYEMFVKEMQRAQYPSWRPWKLNGNI